MEVAKHYIPTVCGVMTSHTLCSPLYAITYPLFSPVFFYNYGWGDYGVPTFPSILDMVKVMDFALGEGKVAVHCHAGLGRTGVLIACYLVYSLRISGEEAVTMVREKR